ncbi:DUF4258 domain-containing protein [Deinococcus yavapaiensis]|uniref:Uncharacterized protein DUF4258 n=1 Tax=Deinococcus yavapaiensis KR-236 TaxID=694435 RepID=A0A318SHQ4_9DEIO|nr:DUF4258 domain-containing protein [Deinococcus yavapaiensis]PYE56675.1 uncharacterized protein DUF4258 [Deinococcus yavapaiensis KR-236]
MPLRDDPTLLTLRAEIERDEKQRRKLPPPPAPKAPQKPVKPQRTADLQGVDTSDFALASAHRRLKDAVFDGDYVIKPHAIGHARAEGFLEHDIVMVLNFGRVRAVYPEDRRMLVSGYFEAHGFKLPLHVVVELHRDGRGFDVVTAFVPKHPHHIVSRQRLALMLRWDSEDVKARVVTPGNKVGYKNKGRWKRGA